MIFDIAGPMNSRVLLTNIPMKTYVFEPAHDEVVLPGTTARQFPGRSAAGFFRPCTRTAYLPFSQLGCSRKPLNDHRSANSQHKARRRTQALRRGGEDGRASRVMVAWVCAALCRRAGNLSLSVRCGCGCRSVLPNPSIPQLMATDCLTLRPGFSEQNASATRPTIQY